MTKLDSLYIRLLNHGLVMLRDAIASNDNDWSYAAAEMLHNVPSLIAETNAERHWFYWDKERQMYLSWLSHSGNDRATAHSRTFFEPIWKEMEPTILGLPR